MEGAGSDAGDSPTSAGCGRCGAPSLGGVGYAATDAAPVADAAVDVADAAEIAFAFFADVGDEQQGQSGDDAELMEGCGEGPERGESGAVVADAGAQEAGLLAADIERGGGGEDCVEVGAEGDCRGGRWRF